MSARIKVALVAALSVMTASCAHLESLAGPALRPGALAGTWEGTGIQSPADDNPSWPMRLVLDAGGDGVVSYPSLNCGGTLTRVGPGRGGVVYREVITQGVETCISGGTVTLAPANGKLFWYWTGENSDDPEVNASAVLTRTGD
jgi:hypothetical protein